MGLEWGNPAFPDRLVKQKHHPSVVPVGLGGNPVSFALYATGFRPTPAGTTEKRRTANCGRGDRALKKSGLERSASGLLLEPETFSR